MPKTSNRNPNLSIKEHDSIESIFGLVKANRSVSLEEMQEAIAEYPVEKFNKTTLLTDDFKIINNFNSAEKY